MNRNVKRCLSALIAAALMCLSVLPAMAEDKKETVYAFADAKGNVNSVTASIRLYNDDKRDELRDFSTLKDIENIGGDQTYVMQDGEMVWQAGGEEITYEGNTEQPLPVKVSFTYTLDGQPISPEDLQGKSGHLVIDI